MVPPSVHLRIGYMPCKMGMPVIAKARQSWSLPGFIFGRSGVCVQLTLRTRRGSRWEHSRRAWE